MKKSFIVAGLFLGLTLVTHNSRADTNVVIQCNDDCGATTGGEGSGDGGDDVLPAITVVASRNTSFYVAVSSAPVTAISVSMSNSSGLVSGIVTTSSVTYSFKAGTMTMISNRDGHTIQSEAQEITQPQGCKSGCEKF